jgi:hypothetical protein
MFFRFDGSGISNFWPFFGHWKEMRADSLGRASI